MTNPVKLLAKMTPRGLQIGNAVQGGTVEVAACDVAAGLAGLAHGPYRVVLAKYLGDQKAAQLLLALIAHKMELQGAREGWSADPEVMRRAAFLACLGPVWDILCTGCSGRGVIYKQAGLVEDCPACIGRGTISLAAKAAADLLEVPVPVYQRIWHKRVSRYSILVSEWEQAALSRLCLKFSEEGVAN